MTFPWVEYLRLAEALLQSQGSFAHQEACVRASMSRAYYAVFCAARNHAVTQEGLVIPGTGRDHRLVQHHFQHGPTPEHVTLGWLLSCLRRARNQADYANRMQQAGLRAQEAILSAQQAFAVLHILTQRSQGPSETPDEASPGGSEGAPRGGATGKEGTP